MNISRIVSKASNLKVGTNPPFAMKDFQEMYPQFFEIDKIVKSIEITEDEFQTETEIIKSLIPNEVMEMYIELADSCIKQSRYRKMWKHCMCLFIAHFTTLYMQSMVEANSDLATVIHAGQTKGLVASKSVDGVSVSYDFQAMQDLEGFAAWKSTTYGFQLATLAKVYSKGGLYV